MKIGILGSGMMGSKLGTIWARAGHEVTFSYARKQDKLDRLARDAQAKAGTPSEAVREADAILLAVHWSRVDDVLAKAGNLSGKIVINCCVPLDMENTNLVVGTTMSGAEELAHRFPEVRWVSAFNTSPSEALLDVFQRQGALPKPNLIFYGDNTAAKEIAKQLISEAGYDPLDAGPLRTARFVEPFAMVTAELAYSQPGGPKLIYRFDRLP